MTSRKLILVILTLCSLPVFSQDVLVESDSDDGQLLSVKNTGTFDKNAVYIESGTDYGVGLNVVAGQMGLQSSIGNSLNYSGITGISSYVYGQMGSSVRFLDGYVSAGDYSYNHGLIAYISSGINSTNYGTQVNLYGGPGSDNYGVYAYVDGGGFNAAGFFNGELWRVSEHNASDQKLKKNIRDLDGGLDKVMALRPRVYEMRKDEFKGKMNLPSGEKIGFVAQEVEVVLPQLVTEGVAPAHLTQKEREEGVKKESTKFKGVDYSGVIPVLVKAIQEQQARIESLQAEVNALASQK